MARDVSSSNSPAEIIEAVADGAEGWLVVLAIGEEAAALGFDGGGIRGQRDDGTAMEEPNKSSVVVPS
jgi:hypothetical protein